MRRWAAKPEYPLKMGGGATHMQDFQIFMIIFAAIIPRNIIIYNQK